MSDIILQKSLAVTYEDFLKGVFGERPKPEWFALLTLFSEIDTATETTYADESCAANRTYYYSMKAVGTLSESDFSAFVAGKR